MNCRVVLVRPRTAANVGAVARVMRNMGVADLVLVEPRADPADPRARRLATHGAVVLDHCRMVGGLGEAVAECVLVAATSGRSGGLFRRQSCASPEDVMPHLVRALPAGPVALVFGPETVGLTNEEISRCHYLIHIPTDSKCPALNLGQAVAVCLYELRRTWLRQAEPTTTVPAPAPFAEQERMFDSLREALERVGFLYGDRADTLWHAVRHSLGRAGPSAMEVKVMLGLARQLLWFAEHGATQSPDDAPEGLP
jgi:tRNA/rRNA methyltransferase